MRKNTDEQLKEIIQIRLVETALTENERELPKEWILEALEEELKQRWKHFVFKRVAHLGDGDFIRLLELFREDAKKKTGTKAESRT